MIGWQCKFILILYSNYSHKKNRLQYQVIKNKFSSSLTVKWKHVNIWYNCKDHSTIGLQDDLFVYDNQRSKLKINQSVYDLCSC